MEDQEEDVEILNSSVDLFEDCEKTERRSGGVDGQPSPETINVSPSPPPLIEKCCLDIDSPSSFNQQSSAGNNSTSLLHDLEPMTTRKKRLSPDDNFNEAEINDNPTEVGNDEQSAMYVQKHQSHKNNEVDNRMDCDEYPSQIKLSMDERGASSQSGVNGENDVMVEKSREPKAVELACPLCGLKEISLYRLQFHIETEHLEMASEASSQQTGSEDMMPKAKSQIDPQTRATGMATMNSGVMLFTCPLCDLSLDDDVCLEVHVREDHKDELDFSSASGHVLCPLCDAVFTSEEEIQPHIKSHSNSPVYIGVHSDGGAAETSVRMTGPEKSDFSCPMCGWRFSDSDLLTSHVESHFSPQDASARNSFRDTAQSGGSSNRPASHGSKGRASSSGSHKRPRYETQNGASSSGTYRGKGSYRRQFEQNLERAVMRGELSTSEFYEQRSSISVKDLRGVDDGHSRVEGLIERLHLFFGHNARPSQSIHLCSPTDHFAGSYGDRGWGCGYRNFQMVLSCLLKNTAYARKMFPDGNATVPSIPRIQELLESAWRQGFDVQGSQQLNGRLVNTRKWIGGTEIAALLSFLGVRCQIADFHVPSADDGTHPRLMQWVTDYFLEEREFKPPLYLQHQGHSRTIIGVERDRGTVKLLLFDPGTPKKHMAGLARGALCWKDMKTFRRTQAAFRAKQYQIVAVMGLLPERDYQSSKVLFSERVS